jgi:hypothetical protein
VKHPISGVKEELLFSIILINYFRLYFKSVNMNFLNSKTVLLIITLVALNSNFTLAQTAGTNNTLGTTGITAVQSTPAAGYKLSIGGATKIFGTGTFNTVASPSLLFSNTNAATRKYILLPNNTGQFILYDSALAISNFIYNGAAGKFGLGAFGTASSATPTLPDSTLHINGGFKLVNGSQGLGKILVSDAVGGASWQTPVTYYNNNAGAGYRLALPNTTNIKTLFPGYAAKLDSTSNVNGITLIVDTAVLSTKYLRIADTASKWQPKGNYLTAANAWGITGNTTNAATDFLGTTGFTSLRIRTNNTFRMIVDSLGNVGIGNATPTQKLDVAGTIKATGLILPTGAAAGKVLTSDASGNATWGSAAAGWGITGNTTNAATDFLGTTGFTSLRIRTNNTFRMIVDSLGNIGIGNATPTQKLDVAGTIKATGLILPTGAAAGKVLASDASGNATWVNATNGGTVTSFAFTNANGFTGTVATSTNTPVLTLSTTLIGLLRGNGTALTTGQANLATEVTGILPAANGGTGLNSIGANGTVLTISGGVPTWLAPAATTSGWALGGNAGTNPSSNFIGTTDGQRLVFKTNNIEQGTILANGNVGIGTSSPAYKLDVNGSLRSAFDMIVNGVTVGRGGGNDFHNTTLGMQAGTSNTTGYYNTFVGYNSGALNTTGTNNVFIGSRTGSTNTIAYGNTFVGDGAGALNTGGNNTFIGLAAGGGGNGGGENTIVGAYSGVATVADGNVFTGFRTGYNNWIFRANRPLKIAGN